MSGDARPHAHAHGFTKAEAHQARRLGMVLAITCSFVTLELTGAILARSQVLLADALHLLLDVVALGMSIGAMRLAVRPPSERFTFGLRRVEPLAALANGLLVVLVAALIVREALEDLASRTGEHTPRPTLMLIVASAALVVHGLSAFLIHDAIEHGHLGHDHGHAHEHDHDHAHEHEHDHAHEHEHEHERRAHGGHALNLRAVWLHLIGDVLGALTALGAAVAIRAGASARVDSVGSIVVALILGAGAYRLLRDAVLILIDAAPSHLPVAVVRAAVTAAPGVVEVLDVRVWTLGAGHDAVAVKVRGAAGEIGVVSRVEGRLRTLGAEFVTVEVSYELTGPT